MRVLSLLSFYALFVIINEQFANCKSNDLNLAVNLIMDKLLEIPAEEAFKAWQHVHKQDLKYSMNSNESNKRFAAFKENIDKIKAHNADKANTWKMALTRYSDLTLEEFRASMPVISNNIETKQKAHSLGKLTYDLNGFYFIDVGVDKYSDWNAVDWTQKVGEVLDQKSCGGCYSFTYVNTLEAAINIKYNKTVKLSRQDLVDCNPLTQGCEGGNSLGAALYIANWGIALDADYPYSILQMKCKVAPRTKYIHYLESVGSLYNSHSVKKMLANGPLYAAIDSGVLQNYKGGIIDASKGCGRQPNHAVTIVAYGVDLITMTPYWKIKNSWGAAWGENGYFRVKVQEDANFNCFLHQMAARPVLLY